MAVETYYDYLRQHSQELGARILELYSPVQAPDDPVAPEVASLLRKPLPTQAITISGLAKVLETSRSVRIVGECGTGKSNKNDFVDSEAVAQVVERKNIRFVPIKTDDQLDLQAIHRVRDRLIARRTAVINQLRAFLLE